MFEEVAFTVADGTTLRGHFYAPTGGANKTPVIVMAPGFAGTLDLCFLPFAEAFATAGLAVLAYDHRNFGISDGAVRQEVDPFQQINDWREAITFAQTRPGVDPDRVGVWGTSFGGGHALVLAATDARIKCVVSQVPFISGSMTAKLQGRPDLAGPMAAMFAGDRIERMKGGQPQMLPVISEDPFKPAVLPTADAYSFTMRFVDQARTWRNEVTLRSMELAGAYEPGAYVGRITPRPLLMIVGKRDQLTVPELALDAYARALEPKQLLILDGGHFDPYDRLLAESSSAATDWFVKHLGV